ncbi:MAG: acyl carrier protein [Candidatus Omnitrophota bacterium]
MKLKDIEDKLVKQLAAIISLPAVKVKPQVPLHELGVDSLSFVELLVFIEKEFKIKLMESGITRNDFKTLHSLAERINKIRG